MTPVEGLLKFTNKHLDRLEAAVARVLATRDIEPVHELRVSSRRLSEPLELIGEALGRKRTRKLRGDLGRLRGSLRRVRDVDVLRLALAEAGANPVGSTEDLTKLQGLLAIQRESELESARKTLRKCRPDRIRDEIASSLKTFESRFRDHGKRLLHDARDIWHRKAGALLERPPVREHAPGLHKTRIKLKALRYSTELMGRLDGENREVILKQFAGMQDRLGAWNDHVCATALLAQLVQNDQTLACDPVWSAAVLEYAARRARSMSDELTEVLVLWPRLRTAVELHVFGREERDMTGASLRASSEPAAAMGR